MTFEQKIVENSKQATKVLYRHAEKASKTPAAGIKIVITGAYYVIRDCAITTLEYLPLKLYAYYKNPIKELKGVFSKKEITEFINKIKTEIPAKQLCKLILDDISNEPKTIVTTSVVNEAENDDIYGDYGRDSSEDVIENTKTDLDNLENVISIFCKAFEAK